MAIYTKTGDKGLTRLADGSVMSKAETRIVAMGDLDELNSLLGLFTSGLEDNKLKKFIHSCQSTIFTIGAHLASNGPESLGNMKLVSLNEIVELEEKIDEIDEELEPLRNFILPSGNETIARVHVCRSVCRRAERSLIKWINENYVQGYDIALVYLNRLSDYLFVLARKLHKDYQIKETPWISGK